MRIIERRKISAVVTTNYILAILPRSFPEQRSYPLFSNSISRLYAVRIKLPALCSSHGRAGQRSRARFDRRLVCTLPSCPSNRFGTRLDLPFLRTLSYGFALS